MRRAQAILLVLTLAALPVIMLAQAGEAPGCDGMCCARHATRPASSGQRGGSEGMSCHHGAIHMFECGMKSQRHALDFGLLAPITPTMTSAATKLVVPPVSRPATAQSEVTSLPGFLPEPFEPPRA
jgi:hypothetical protein